MRRNMTQQTDRLGEPYDEERERNRDVTHHDQHTRPEQVAAGGFGVRGRVALGRWRSNPDRRLGLHVRKQPYAAAAKAEAAAPAGLDVPTLARALGNVTLNEYADALADTTALFDLARTILDAAHAQPERQEEF